MQSPASPGTEMKKIIKMGVEIEYCPVTGGVWLDKGELEKLIQLAESNSVMQDDNAPKIFDEPIRNQTAQTYQNNSQGYYPPAKPKKKESFLSEIFDIF